ncbi:4'-phosphopantetheinyl transferase, partial [Tremellales sp. Uapishka_1]
MRIFAIRLPEAPPQETVDILASCLPPDVQKRISRFRRPSDALRTLVSHLLPIWYFRQHMGLLTPLSFVRSSKGRPSLVSDVLLSSSLSDRQVQASPPDLQVDFNTSHEGSCVLLGVVQSLNARIGVDVMQFPADARDLQEGISDQLTVQERQMLAIPMTEAERAIRLTTLWTTKEAYVKAIGEGVAMGLQRINVRIKQRLVEAIEVDGRDLREDGWKWIWREEGDYGLAVVYQHDGLNEASNLEWVQWDAFSTFFTKR